MIGKLNRRVTIRRWATQQDDGGGSDKVLVDAWDTWAQVEDRSGFSIHSQEQDQWQYDYKVTMRYAESRKVGSNDTIDYEDKRLKINSLSVKSEGSKRFIICRCSTIENITLDEVYNYPENYEVNTYYFTASGSGGEDSFTVPALINKKIISAFKDGVNFAQVTSFTEGKQFIYTQSTGQIQWSVPFEPGEQATVVYGNI